MRSLVVFLSFFFLRYDATASANFQVERPLMNTDFERADKLSGIGSKYFRESKFSYHYDGRYADHTVPDDRRLDYLRILAQAYLETMANVGVETWIMHGTLLGWWWNQKIMPWDNDLDVQVSEAALWFLWDNYNLRQHEFTLEDGSKRSFVLEINPNFKRRHRNDRFNVIDARWIDTSSGLFIDVTAVREDFKASAEGTTGVLRCKDRHTFLATDIFPLRRATFEGLDVHIPFAYTKLLKEEYGEKALTNTYYFGYHFNETSKEWYKESVEQKRSRQEEARKNLAKQLKLAEQLKKNQHP